MHLVLGLHLEIEIALQRYGIKHLTLVEHSKGEYARSLGDPICIVTCANPCDPEVVLATLKHVGIDPATIHLIWGTGESTLVTASLVAAVLGRPTRLNPWAALGFRDMWMQKQRIENAGLATARQYLIHSLNDISDAVGHVGFPAVVKPLYGTSDLTFRVEDETQLWNAVSEIMEVETENPKIRYGTVLMEEFLVGGKFLIDGCLFDGKVQTISISQSLDKNVEGLRCGGHSSVILLEPDDEQDLYREAAAFAHQALRVLELYTGSFHMKVIHTPNGLRFLSCGAFPGGDGISESFRYKFKIDLFDEHVRSLCGMESTPAVQTPGFFSQISLNAPSGVVVTMPTIEDLLNQPGVLMATIDVSVGELIPNVISNTSVRPASAIVHSHSLGELKGLIVDLKEWFYSTFETHEVRDAMEDAIQRVVEMLRGHTVTQLVASAARLDLYDIINSGINKRPDISLRTGISEVVLSRYLSALEMLGLVLLPSEDVVVATEALALLDRKSGKLYGQAILSGDQYYRAWSELDYALTCGKSAFENAIGHGLWEELNRDPYAAEQFTRTMGQNMTRVAPEIIARYQFPDRGTLIDLGAGDGTLSIEILKARPALHAILVEQESVFPSLKKSVSNSDVAGRCTAMLGNILTEVPSDGDFYIMKSVLHNWGDDDAIRILKNCRAAMGTESRLLLIERVILTQISCESALRDLVMLVLFGSGDRTMADLERLLNLAGLRVTKVDDDQSGLFLIEVKRMED